MRFLKLDNSQILINIEAIASLETIELGLTKITLFPIHHTQAQMIIVHNSIQEISDALEDPKYSRIYLQVANHRLNKAGV